MLPRTEMGHKLRRRSLRRFIFIVLSSLPLPLMLSSVYTYEVLSLSSFSCSCCSISLYRCRGLSLYPILICFRRAFILTWLPSVHPPLVHVSLYRLRGAFLHCTLLYILILYPLLSLCHSFIRLYLPDSLPFTSPCSCIPVSTLTLYPHIHPYTISSFVSPPIVSFVYN